MDEAIDRYVGGVKHVTMNVYIYTDISGIFDVTIHDAPADQIATLSVRIGPRIVSRSRKATPVRYIRPDGAERTATCPARRPARSRYERDITVRSPAGWL
jgi:hypothetical protein